MSETSKFSGNKVGIGLVVYMFFSQAIYGVSNACYGLYADAYSTTFTFVGTCLSMLTLSGTLLGLSVTAVKKRIGIKNCLYVAAVAIMLNGVQIYLFAGHAFSYLIVNVLNGFELAFGAFAVLTEIANNWFVNTKRRNDFIALFTGASCVGQAVFQTLAGACLVRFDFFPFYALINVIIGAAMLVVTRLFVVAGSPDEIGELPMPEDDAVLAAQTAASESGAGAETAGGLTGSIYKNPVLYLSIIAKITGAAAVTYISLYATMFFNEIGGMPYDQAAAFASSFAILSGLASFVSGRLATALKPIKYLIFVYIFAMLGNWGMIQYQSTPSILLVIVIMAGYAFGFLIGTANNLLAAQLFSREQAMDANSKIYAIGLLGYMVLAPFTGYLLDNFGYTPLYWAMVAINAVSLVAYLLAAFVAKKQGLPVE